MAVKPIYAVGLDAGSRRTRLVICLLEQGRLRFLGCGSVESQGWVKGRIADQSAVAESILAALREAEASARVSVESVVVGMGGPTVRGANGRGVIELGHVREIEQRDVNRVVDRASHVQLQEDRMVLQLFPQDFVVDDHPGHRDPRKMMASRLEINVHLVISSVQEHKALVGAVNQAHLLGGGDGLRRSGRLLRGGSARRPPRGHRGGGYRRAIHRTGGLLRRRHAPGVHHADLRRSLHARPGAGPVPQLEDAELVKLEFGCALSESCLENVLVELPTPENRERRTRIAASSTRSWKRARPSCSSLCAPNWRAWAWSAR